MNPTRAFLLRTSTMGSREDLSFIPPPAVCVISCSLPIRGSVYSTTWQCFVTELSWVRQEVSPLIFKACYPILQRCTLVHSKVFPTTAGSKTSKSVGRRGNFTFHTEISVSTGRELSPSFYRYQQISYVDREPVVFLEGSTFPPCPPSFMALRQDIFSFVENSRDSIPDDSRMPRLEGVGSSFSIKATAVTRYMS